MKPAARVDKSAGRRWFVRRIAVIPSRRKGWFLSPLPCTPIHQDPSVPARCEGIPCFLVYPRVSSFALPAPRLTHVPLDCSGFIITRCSPSPRSFVAVYITRRGNDLLSSNTMSEVNWPVVYFFSIQARYRFEMLKIWKLQCDSVKKHSRLLAEYKCQFFSHFKKLFRRLELMPLTKTLFWPSHLAFHFIIYAQLLSKNLQ